MDLSPSDCECSAAPSFALSLADDEAGASDVDDNQGTNSPGGCGTNSDYHVYWQ
jgi:hypothetical protein